MSIRFGWVLKSAAIGLVALLLVCYVFSMAYSISARQEQMLIRLDRAGDRTFDYALGSGDIMLLAALGSLIALFAGGMAAALLARPERAFSGDWLAASAVVAMITILAVDSYMMATWSDSVQKWYKSPVDEYGRPFEPAVLPALLILMLVADGACLAVSAAGGLIVEISKNKKLPLL